MKKVLCMTALTGLFACFGAAAQSQPKLVLQITVDALRGDLEQRFRHNMGEGGFNYLLDKGIYYDNAHYQHANTETIVGHVSLATGAPPKVHGMVGNVWFDRAENRAVYNIEDERYHLLTSGADVDKSAEIDSTQKVAKGDGRSPLPMLSSTFSDELALAYNGQSKVFAVSVKDRGAVSLAGQYGKAFWFSKSAGEFVSSDYYYQQYPGWVDAFNQSKPLQGYHEKSWQLSLDQSKYLFKDEKGTDGKTELAGFGTRFPHAYGPTTDKYFTTKLTLSPAGDELTLAFTQALIAEEQLGQDAIPDYLAVSFSSNDYVIHMFGPSSLEAEDNLLRLDRSIAQLLKTVDEKVGLEHTLIVLSADHGAPDTPSYLQAMGDQKAEYFNFQLLDAKVLSDLLSKALNQKGKWVEQYAQPYIYLDHDLVKQHKLDLAKVQQVLADRLSQVPNIQYAVPTSRIVDGQLANTRVMNLVANNYHPQRSGDVHLIFSPNVYINDLDGLKVASVHGSPWRYDTYVPVVFAGMKLAPERVNRAVTPYDIAPTLAHYLKIAPPNGATGSVLEEVVER
ncbi:alkaline phosphatase family protein [Motilimonas pumila]|uniref:Alkaline phosphatase family protein n=1 Tax=Motilimonas pumila TaxID=2303987 RepID=A0A418YHQ9_9GAMM|nr:alkaline phosphatase family protein [Motilimonas pumila]RJG49918.1 alkaline phosphatase family protein [Motilimonas pumila]